MHFWVSDNFWDELVIETLHDFGIAFTFELQGFIGSCDGFCEDVMTDTLPRLERCANNEILMVRVGKFEFNNWWITQINVCLFVCIFLDRFVWWF